MKLKQIHLLFILVIPMFLFFSCKDSAVSPPYIVGNVSIVYNAAIPVYEIDFGTDDETEITLTGDFSSTKDMFLVKMNSNNSVVNSTNAGYVKSENLSRSIMPPLSGSVMKSESTLPFKKDHTASMEFLNLYQPEEESGIIVPSRSVIPEREDSIEKDKVYVVGNTESFWVQDADGNFIEINAILKAQGEYSNIWISDSNVDGPVGPDYSNYDNGSTADNDNKLNDTNISDLESNFNGTGGIDYNGIYELITNVFGYEYGGGSDGGKDGDLHVNILVYDIDYDFTPSLNGGVFGYFWGKDYYSDSLTLSEWGIRSNEAEIFYLDSHFLDKYPDSMYLTLAHEFQHMIHFNEKAIKKGLYSATWYNEMLSMLAEDIMQDKLSISDSSSPIGRTYEFVDGYHLSGVTDWLGGNDVYYSYASAFIFGAFLTRNFGGADLIEAMIDSNSVNQASVTDALVSSGYSESFTSVFNKYHTALIYSTENLVNDILVTNVSSSATINSVIYNQTAFDIYDSTYSTNGPLVFPADNKLTLRPMGMSIHDDNLWKNLTGTQTLNLNIVAPTPGVKYYLMFR